MRLKVGPSDLATIRRHGETSYPHECCGFLLGRVEGEAKEVVRILAAPNERGDAARNRYLLSPEAYLRAEVEAERQGLEIVGFYHSHPDAPARPSEFDRAHALPWCSYLIVAVEGGAAGESTSWVLSENHLNFEREEITSP